MYGELRRDRRAQLAVMDAILFFLVAGVVSSVMLANAFGSRVPGDPGLADRLSGRAAEMLRAFLDASIGRQVVLFADGSELVVPASSEIADCITAELAALEKGVDQVAFRDLNEALCAALSAIAGPSVRALVCVHDTGSHDSAPVLALPETPPDSRNIYASSCVLGEEAGAAYLIVLLLDPSPLPESLDVR